MPYVHYYDPNKPTEEVKDLNWLLDHASEIESITLLEFQGGKATLRAYGPTYMFYYQWESFPLAMRWLKRPCLNHVPQTITPYIKE